MNKPRAVTYCSFADQSGCLGVCILEGELNPVEAAKKAHELKINPGGQLLAMSCFETDSDVPLNLFEAMWNNKNKLISQEDAGELFDAKSVKEHDTNEREE